MGDLWGAVALVWLLAGALFWLGLLAGRRASPATACVLAMPGLVLIVLHTRVFADSLLVSWVFPVSSVAVLGNWTPLAVGWLAGLAWSHGPGLVWRKLVVVLPLVALCVWYAHGWLVGSAPVCGEKWVKGVCLQTSRATCSAACAATLLHAHGIAATEQEMARLCLTRDSGTSQLGLYRGLKLKTAGTPYAVEVFSGTVDELRRQLAGPVVLDMQVEGEARAGRGNSGARTPGQRHTVVLFGFLPGGIADVGDPSAGRERWPVERLAGSWRGVGLRLVGGEQQ